MRNKVEHAGEDWLEFEPRARKWMEAALLPTDAETEYASLALPANHEVVAGELVQLNPETCRNMMFAGCIMTVTETKPWGAQGYVQALGADQEPGGQAYYRAKWDEMERTGGMAPFCVER